MVKEGKVYFERIEMQYDEYGNVTVIFLVDVMPIRITVIPNFGIYL